MTSQARILKVRNSLAEVVTLPGGKTVADALRGAASRIAEVREPCLAALRDRIEQLAAASAAGHKGEPGVLDAIYSASNDILGLSAAVEAPEVADAAYSLCELADAFRQGAAPNWPAVDVHVNALRILSVDGLKPAARAQILLGLNQVRARVLPSS